MVGCMFCLEKWARKTYSTFSSSTNFDLCFGPFPKGGEASTPNELTPVNPQVEYMYRDSAKSPEPTYDDKWNTMERSNAWFVNPIHEQYECGANELASALQDTAITNACQQKLYEEVDNY